MSEYASSLPPTSSATPLRIAAYCLGAVSVLLLMMVGFEIPRIGSAQGEVIAKQHVIQVSSPRTGYFVLRDSLTRQWKKGDVFAYIDSFDRVLLGDAAWEAKKRTINVQLISLKKSRSVEKAVLEQIEASAKTELLHIAEEISAQTRIVAEANLLTDQLAATERKLADLADRSLIVTERVEAKAISKHQLVIEGLRAKARVAELNKMRNKVTGDLEISSAQYNLKQLTHDGAEEKLRAELALGEIENRTALIMPIDGSIEIVEGLWAGYVQSGQHILNIKSQEFELAFIGRIAGEQLGSLKEGNRAFVELKSHPKAYFGVMEGVISRLNHTAARKSSSCTAAICQQPHFEMQIDISDREVSRFYTDKARFTGLEMSVEFEAERGTVAQFFFEPLLRLLERSKRATSVTQTTVRFQHPLAGPHPVPPRPLAFME